MDLPEEDAIVTPDNSMTSSPATVLIVGASGFLGRVLMTWPAEDLHRVPASRAGEGHVRIDLTDPESIRRAVDEVGPDCVIHAAAFTSVDGCETAPEDAQRIHVDGTRHLAEACESAGARLLSLSSNYVFDGRDGPYAETDPPSPLNVYGSTKLDGERAVLGSGERSLVVRTAVLYGFAPGAHLNFVTWAASELASKRQIRVVTDEWANPAFVDELANFLLTFCRDTVRPLDERIIHFAGADFLTRYEMVNAICGAFDLDERLVQPVTSADLDQKANRPLRAGLRIDLAKSIYPGRIASFDENLQMLASRIPDPTSLSRA